MILGVLNYLNIPVHLTGISEYLGILGVRNCTAAARIQACEMVTPKKSAKILDKPGQTHRQTLSSSPGF